MDAEVTHDVHISVRDGYNFFNLTNIHVKFDIEGLKMRLNNLFNGVKALGELFIIDSPSFTYALCLIKIIS